MGKVRERGGVRESLGSLHLISTCITHIIRVHPTNSPSGSSLAVAFAAPFLCLTLTPAKVGLGVAALPCGAGGVGV